MRCDKVRGFVEEWLDGGLSGAERAACERHLQGCAACADYLEQRRRLGKALKRTLAAQSAGLRFQPPEPSRLASAVGAAGSPSRLASAVGAARSPESSFRPRFSAPRLLALAAALLLALLFLFRPWAARQRTGDGPAATGVITVSDSLTLEDDTFISGRMNSFSYVIHMQVSGVRVNDHT
jgi:anti-sigma factor RsiW